MLGDIIGRGWAFPPRLDHRGQIALVGDAEEIEQAIRIILNTAPGQRVMRPEFGCRLHELLFEGNTAILHGLVRHEVCEALTRWEPRIVIDEASVTSDDHAVLVAIRYHLIGSQVESNFVFPYYRGTV